VASKNTIREMARSNLITNPSLWIKFIDGRNETSHSYDEDVAQKIYALLIEFLPYSKDLLNNLKKIPL
jgi:nucleotidyltransferase substrate binding protein (TIGR01987 family)